MQQTLRTHLGSIYSPTEEDESELYMSELASKGTKRRLVDMMDSLQIASPKPKEQPPARVPPHQKVVSGNKKQPFIEVLNEVQFGNSDSDECMNNCSECEERVDDDKLSSTNNLDCLSFKTLQYADKSMD